MRIRVPPKKIRERFLLIYELEDCQKAVNFLTAYYGVRRLRIVLDGRRAGNGNIASYFENKAYFTKRGLNKQILKWTKLLVTSSNSKESYRDLMINPRSLTFPENPSHNY